MNRDEMIKFLEENPNVKVTHYLFDEHEYIYQKENGKVYDENGCLFEDWFSNDQYKHNGIRMRASDDWFSGWEVKENFDKTEIEKIRIENSRKIIVDGLQELQKVCNTIPTENCHSKCLYEDICLKLNCVGYGTGVKIQPCDWRLEELR